jgi:hypothetical protein
VGATGNCLIRPILFLEIEYMSATESKVPLAIAEGLHGKGSPQAAEARVANETRKIRLKCASTLIGSQVHVAGDTVEISEERAECLCQADLAEPVGVAGWFKKLLAALKPADAVERLDEPGVGRHYRCEVRERRSVFHINRSYGAGSIVYLDESGARLHRAAGNVELIDPPSLPVRAETPKDTYPVNRFGVSSLAVGAPPRLDASDRAI